MFLLDIHCRRKHSVYFVPLMPYSTSYISVTLKSGLGSFKVIENGTTRNLTYGFLFDFYSKYGRICRPSCFDTIPACDRYRYLPTTYLPVRYFSSQMIHRSLMLQVGSLFQARLAAFGMHGRSPSEYRRWLKLLI